MAMHCKFSLKLVGAGYAPVKLTIIVVIETAYLLIQFIAAQSLGGATTNTASSSRRFLSECVAVYAGLISEFICQRWQWDILAIINEAWFVAFDGAQLCQELGHFCLHIDSQVPNTQWFARVNFLDVINHFVLLQTSVCAKCTLPQIDVQMTKDVHMNEEFFRSLCTTYQTLHLSSIILVQTSDFSIKTSATNYTTLLQWSSLMSHCRNLNWIRVTAHDRNFWMVLLQMNYHFSA